MEQRLNRIEEKLDRIVDIQAEMRADIAEHIRRTEIAESNIEKLSNNIKPIQEHVAFIRGIGKLITILLAAAAAVATIWQSFGGK